MKKNSPILTDKEAQMIEQMREHPELLERFQAILGLTQCDDGPVRRADDVEDMLVDEVRRLGNTTMREWAKKTEEKAARQLKAEHPKSHCAKKKALSWYCLFGAVEIEERIWCTPEKRYVRVFAPAVGVSAYGKSRRLQRVLADFGAENSFEASCKRVKEHYGFEINASAVRIETMRHARRAAEMLESEYAESFRVLPKKGAAYVIAEADGTMICTVEPGPRKAERPRSWQEMRLVAAEAQGSTTPVYGATFGDVDDTGRRWGHCTRQAGWALSSQIHVLADGAEWIEKKGREVFGNQLLFTVDFFHLSEYLAAASESCRPKQPKRWLKTQQDRLKRGASDKVIKALKVNREADTVPDEQAPVRCALRYLSNRLDQIDYPRALANDLPIGSGMIESGHRHVLQARLKRAGTAWLKQNAHDLAQLRVLRSNNRWEEYWLAQKAA